MQKITPCLWFEKDCEEAINFYVSVFNSSTNKKANSKIVGIKRYPEGIKDAPWPPQMAGKVITAVFELAGQQFIALDGGPGVFAKSGVVSLSIECETQEEVDHYWNKLIEGGDPKQQQCGWLQDKYGFSWQVSPNMDKWLYSQDSVKSKRAMEAMLKMKKIIIADLENA